MKFTTKQKLITGITIFIFPLYAYCLSLYIFFSYPNLQHHEKMTIFNRYIIFSDNPTLIQILSISLSIASTIILGRIETKSIHLKFIIYPIIVINALLIIMFLYSLL